jgi:DNA-binding response OmpR family regulator
VEDDPGLRAMYRAALSVSGYMVVAVGDGVDALRRLDWEEPDIVVLDLGLPRLGGLDVQREVRAHADTRDLPIIVVTGSDTSQLDEADFACILKKPVNSEDLVRAVETCLRDYHRKHRT